MTSIFRSKSGEATYAVEMWAVLCGKDMSVGVVGGTHAHIGAVALSIPRPSLKDPNVSSASTSVLTVVGHKEDELAKKAATRLASTFGCTVCVQAGVHIDGASEGDIKLLWENFESALQDIEHQLQAES